MRKQQWPPWGQAIVESGLNKSECMDCPPKNGCCREVAIVDSWSLRTVVFFDAGTNGPGDLANVAVQALLIEINIVICIA